MCLDTMTDRLKNIVIKIVYLGVVCFQKCFFCEFGIVHKVLLQIALATRVDIDPIHHNIDIGFQ